VKDAKPQLDEEVKQTSNSMIEVLSKSDNPKHRNSKFLKFLKKLSHGAYTIENEQLVKNTDKIQEFKSMEVERLKEESVRMKEDEQKKTSAREQMFSKMWSGEELDEDAFTEMMQQWESENQDTEYNQ
jgi:hypothetical protein